MDPVISTTNLITLERMVCTTLHYLETIKTQLAREQKYTRSRCMCTKPNHTKTLKILSDLTIVTMLCVY